MLGKLTIMTKPVIPDEDPLRLACAVRYLRVGTSRNRREEEEEEEEEDHSIV